MPKPTLRWRGCTKPKLPLLEAIRHRRAVDADLIGFRQSNMNPFSELLTQVWGWMYPSPMVMYPDEAVSSLQYAHRLERLYTPNPLEGEATHARSCFLLRYYSGKREIFWADTGTQELIPLSFLAFYGGQREYYPDLEIGTPR
jgi:hypothetical protein